MKCKKALKNKKVRHRMCYRRQDGNAMLVTAIILLIISIVVMTCVNLASSQVKIADLTRDTSNTYMLARDGIEKEVDNINKALQAELPRIIEAIGREYINGRLALHSASNDTDKLIRYEEATSTETLAKQKYESFTYDNNKISIKKDSEGLRAFSVAVQEAIFDYIDEHFLVVTSRTGTNVPQPVTYEVKGDQVSGSNKTVITVTPQQITEADEGVDKTQILITATANAVDNAGNVYDSETIEAKVGITIPEDLPNEVIEYYDWVANPSEVLDAPLVVYSDLVLGAGSVLNVTSGDVLVKGYKKAISDTAINDMNQSGGVIVKNGGKLTVADNLYTMANVVATNGWNGSSYDAETTISVDGNIIANTLGIMDNFYSGSSNQTPTDDDTKGKGININVGMNAIVDNDVLIDRAIKDSFITVNGTIFGLSGGTQSNSARKTTISGKNVLNPNLSSGVFAMGDGTKIKADRLIIAGQPFVTLAHATAGYNYPVKLFESAGAPFDNVWSIPAYQSGNPDTVAATNGAYLDQDPYKSFINADRIETHVTNSYAVARISATEYGTTTKYKAYQVPNTGLGNQSNLWNYLFQGIYNDGSGNKTFTSYGSTGTGLKDYTKIDYIINQPVNNYLGNAYGKSPVKIMADEEKAYCRKMGNFAYDEASGAISLDGKVLKDYLGIKAYAMTTRSAFIKSYTANDVVSQSGSTITWVDQALLNFNEMVDITGFTARPWSLDNPILVVDDTTASVDISKFYKEVGLAKEAYPTIIINSDKTRTLKLKTTVTTKNEFNGVIISAGPVEITGGTSGIDINGTLIIGGPEGTPSTVTSIYENGDNNGLSIVGTVNIAYDKGMLFKVDAKDRELYRKVLNALKLTQYDSSKKNLELIVGEYNVAPLNYTMGKVGFSDRSYLWVDSSQITMSIITEKKKS